MIETLQLAYLTRDAKSHSNKKKVGNKQKQGKFGRYLTNPITYKTLRVIPKSKRTPENCDENGIAKG